MVGGAIVIPALACAIGMAYLGTHLREQLQSWRPKIERISVLLLISVWIGNVGQLVSVFWDGNFSKQYSMSVNCNCR